MSGRLFAIADPHLSFARPKPMDVFGPRWDDHVARIRDSWLAEIDGDDVVLLPGDISWAMRLDDAMADLEWLASLPGAKVLLRGNHDYWWPSLKKLEDLRLPGFHFINNNHVEIAGIGIGGSRLWDFPFARWGVAFREKPEGVGQGKPSGERGGDDAKIRAHEIERLERSLAGIPPDVSPRVAMTHFPPLGEDGRPTPLTDLIGSHSIDVCVFGHVHGDAPGPRPGEDIRIGGTRYILVASDHLGHKPFLVADLPR